MCSICGQSPCPPGCPNADDPPTVSYCKWCGEPIVVGEEMYELEDEYYHEECLKDNAFDILVDECGAIAKTAERSDI